MNAHDMARVQNVFTQPGTLEAITFGSRQSTNQSAFNSYTLTRVRWRRMTKSEALRAGGLGATQARIVEIPAKSIANATALGGAPLPMQNPKVRDLITRADGTTWYIDANSVEVTLLEQMYVCQVSQFRPG